jgi:hypothetical protein
MGNCRSSLSVAWTTLANAFHIPFLYDGYTAVGTLEGWAVGTWTSQQWMSGHWAWGLDLGAGLFWSQASPWTRHHDWTDITWSTVLFLPVETDVPRSSQTTWTFVAEPAWGLVLHPRVSWEPAPWLRLELSRWLPWAGGWSLRQDSSTANNPSGSPASLSDSLAGTDPRNLWLAGTEFRVLASW